MQKSNYIKYAVLFILLILLQVLIFNRISFLGYATPFLYIYFIIKLPIGLNRGVVTVLGFVMGFIIDIFCNTPGINAAATTSIAFFRDWIQNLFFMREDYAEQEPGIGLLGLAFMKYAVLLTFIHHLLLSLFESFTFFNIRLVLLRIFCSSILTSLLILAIEGFSKKDKKTWQKTT